MFKYESQPRTLYRPNTYLEGNTTQNGRSGRLGVNPILISFPMSYFKPKTKLPIKKYDGLIRLYVV
jgi:hypothetical protein